MPEQHIAQVNIGRLRAPVDAAEIAEFVANLDPVNALADAAPGFVWRLQDDSGNATSVPVNEDPLVIVNLSVWETIDALDAFVRSGPHLSMLRRRREWFERFDGAYLALWWVPAGHTPTVPEAIERLGHLRTHGPTRHAFTLRERYDATG
jgi:hypothetical protein